MVYLDRLGDAVSGSGTLSLSGRLQGCELLATFGESGGSGSFDWTFSPDGRQFNGTFDAPGFGNAGSSAGRRLGS